MTNEKIKRMFDACYLAKRIREMLPPLPQGVMPSYIQYMDKIQTMEKQGICVKVSDISDALNIPRPGVTRTVKEMETKGYLQKLSSPDDGRVTFITLTDVGFVLFWLFFVFFFFVFFLYLDDISEEDADCMIRTIGKFHEIMSERREHYEK